MEAVTSSPLFGIVLSILAYAVGIWLNRKAKTPLVNPLLVAIILVALVLLAFHIPLEHYQAGGDFIALFLAPATASLALSVYRQREILKKNLFPVLLGCAAGSLTSMLSVSFCLYGKRWQKYRAFRLDEKLTASMLPKSVTTPIAMEISRQHGGIVPVTVAAVIITGILGSMLAPLLIKAFRVKNPVAAGVAIGTASHAVGTSKAVEIGETEGAMSGIAIGISGVFTVLLAMLLP